MEIGKIWPGWEVSEYIGEGSFGKVYKIIREDFGHLYESALKVITIPANKGELASVLNDGFDEESATMYFHGMVEDIVERKMVLVERKHPPYNTFPAEEEKTYFNEDRSESE